jgi:hypothetical protein
MKYGLVWFEQHNGLTGLLPDRANAVSCHLRAGNREILIEIEGETS